MIYTLQNEFLTAKISAYGAELISVKSADGTEFMWQADPRAWGKTAPWLFPICGRLPDGAYTYKGKRYEMPNHGFARISTFTLQASGADFLTLALEPNEEIKAMYPFAFSFEITYRLTGNTIACALSATNCGADAMPASFGGHPGFCVPIGGQGGYEDCYLEFSAPCAPRAVVFSERLLDSGVRAPYTPVDGVRIPLSHAMFASDATFLCDAAEAVTLRSAKSAHAVTVTYGKVPYLGIWSSYPAEGDFVCVEPWHGMASPDGVAAFEEKPDLYWIASGESKTVEMSMTFH